MADPEEYFAEGFDPNSYTMPKLRSVLLSHNVKFSSTAKKANLVQLFEDHIAPMASRKRAEHADVKASSSGIIDMRAQRTDDSEDDKKASPKKPARAGRKSTSLKPKVEVVQDSEPEVPVKRKPGRPRKSAPAATNPSKSPSSVSFAPDSSFERVPSKLGRSAGDESTFSDYNPFQSGSEASPSVGPAAKAAAATRKARRKTTDGRTSKLSRTSSDLPSAESERQTAIPQSVTVPSFKNYMDASLAASTPPRVLGKGLKKSKSLALSSDGADDGQVADEEDYDEDDAADQTQSPSEVAKARSHRRTRSKQSRYAHEDLTTSQKLSQVLWSIIGLGMLAYAIWYARESRTVGFCDVGSTTNDILLRRQVEAEVARVQQMHSLNHGEAEDDDSLTALGFTIPSHIRPTCTPCPPHAECLNGSLPGCSSQDYVLQPSWFDLIPFSSQIFPLGWTAPRCVPDTQKLVLASELASAINQHLARWKGQVVCGYERPHESIRSLLKKGSLQELKYAIAEDVVRSTMFESRDADEIDAEYFQQLWGLAMDDLLSPGSNVVQIATPHGTDLNNTAVSLAARAPMLSLSCRSRLGVRAWLQRTRLYFFLVAGVILLLSWARRSRRLAGQERQKVAELVQVALERLQEQEYLNAVDPVVTPDPFLPTSHLRDHVLREQHSSATRQRLWNKVAKVVEENANVRTRQAMKRGEWLRVWEWVGVVGASMAQRHVDSHSAANAKGPSGTSSPAPASPAY